MKTNAKAMEIIQRNERGRQGKARAQLLKELREEEKRRRIYDATDQLEMDPEIAAANIQVEMVSPDFTLPGTGGAHPIAA